MAYSSASLSLTICSLFALVTSVEPTTNLTKISIYYESLCPGSIDFITGEFYPIYENLKDRILVDFVPYGIASQSKSPSGDWVFRCQHGSPECSGNKYQACALDQKKGQDTNVEFVNCVMSLDYPSDTEGIKNCATSNGYYWKIISSCYHGKRGNELLAAYGTRTHKLNPRLRFVPTIIFDDVFDQRLPDDFLEAACLKISKPKPDVCGSYH